ncbi:MAG: cellulose binding domain-containing protein, partial [Acidothermus sp.]|nr:cellulose binding domain-containing protein [Acidothermus sp.]
TNDYSYGTNTVYQDWSRVTVYVGGVLVWGTEPTGATASPSPTSSPSPSSSPSPTPTIPANQIITIDGNTRLQTIDGFGISEAFGQASAVMAAPTNVQDQIFSLLFSTTTGAGFTILRNLIPSDPNHTIEPTSPGSPAATPSYRDIGDDWGQLPFTQKAITYGVDTIYANAWGAPGFMKTNGSDSNGGTLCGVPNATCASGDWRQAYANYLVQYLRDYKNAGIDIDYVGFENEPNLQVSYSGMLMTPEQSADFVKVFGPTLAQSGLATKMTCCDAEGWQQAPSYANAIISDSVANGYVSLITSHGYTGAPTSPLPSGGKHVWQTEWSTFESWDPAWDDNSAASGLTWADHIYVALTAANLNGFLYWWGTATPQTNGDNESLILLNGTTVTPAARLWAMAGFSRFVRPGSVRLGTTNQNGNLDAVAFQTPAGQTVLVVLNKANSAQQIGISPTNLGNPTTAVGYLTNTANTLTQQPTLSRSAGGIFVDTVPARSMETYVIGGATASPTPSPSPTSSPTPSPTPTPTPTPTPSSTPSPTPSPTPSASPTPTPTPSPTSGVSCTATYSVSNDWGTGFTANVTVTNAGSKPTSGWMVTWTFAGNQTVTNYWNTALAQSGKSVTAKNLSYNNVIQPGQSTTFGFNGAYSGSNSPPTLSCSAT